MNTKSIAAYHLAENSGLLSKRRFEVYDILFHHGPLTGSEVSTLWKKGYGYNCNSENVRNRISELVKIGVVSVTGEKQDPITKMTVSIFDANGNEPIKYKAERKTISIKKYNEVVAYLDKAVEIIEEIKPGSLKQAKASRFINKLNKDFYEKTTR